MVSPDDEAPSATTPVRCMESQAPFAIRFERVDGQWSLMDAIETSDTSGGGSDDGSERRIQGPFRFPPTYPGCPHCGEGGLFHCGECDGLACWDGTTSPVVCPWCEIRTEIEGNIDSVESYEEDTGSPNEVKPSRSANHLQRE